MFLMVTGGSGSGKSEYAERQALRFGPARRYYIATMECFDGESRLRVARHRRMRAGKSFTTIERFTRLEELRLPEGEGPCCVLLECMSNLAANEMFSSSGRGANAFAFIRSGIDSLRKQCDNLIVVTNEIFSDGICYEEETRRYQRLLGQINCYMAQRADEVTEVICGLPLKLKRAE